jgi:hypothetical protein
VQYVNNILRAFNAISDGVVGSFSRAGDMPGTLDQPVFQPPTVFSYYSPDYEVPGAKTLGPEFQILYTTTTVRRANVVNTLVYVGVVPGANNPTGTTLTWARHEALKHAGCAAAARHDVRADARGDKDGDAQHLVNHVRPVLAAEALADGRVPDSDFAPLRRAEVSLKEMANTRRDFLRTAACATVGAALASTFESFGLLDATALSSASS